MNSLIGIILFISMLFSGTLYGNNVTVSESHIQNTYVYDEGFEYEEEYVDYDNNSDDYNYDYDYDYDDLKDELSKIFNY